MNWKEEAVRKLREYEPMRQSTVNIPRQMRQLEEEYQTIRAQRFTGRRTIADPGSREDQMMNNIIRRQELQQSLERACLWMETVDGALQVLEPEEREILQCLYVFPQKGAVDTVCDALHIEKSSVYRRRDKALRKFTLAMYGATESN